jgi:hypothetical protein
MLKKQDVYEVPYGYRAKIGLVVVGPNLNPTPEICRMIPDYIQVRETRIHMDPVVNVEECSKLSEPCHPRFWEIDPRLRLPVPPARLSAAPAGIKKRLR